MKIVSDFDGVVTDQIEEATLVGRLFAERVQALIGDAAAPLLERASVALRQMPTVHGWRSQGRVTAYANEDLFVYNNGLAACIDDWVFERDPAACTAHKRLADAGFSRFSALCQWAYEEMVRRTHAGELKPMDTDAAAVMQTLLDKGHHIVVVSNSGTERIIELLSRAGLQAVAHDRDPKAVLRVRGGAKKFELGSDKRGFFAGDHWLDASRPLYETILREEKPDAVVGDVVSLDLALPIWLAKQEPVFAHTRFCLRERSYTPDWAKQMFADAEKASYFAYQSPSTLADYLLR